MAKKYGISRGAKKEFAEEDRIRAELKRKEEHEKEMERLKKKAKPITTPLNIVE